MREDQAYALEQAILHADTGALGRLLTAEPKLTGTPIPVPCAWGEEMWLGLHRSAELGGLASARLLLDAGASIDARTRFRTPMHGRETALIIASRCGHVQMVELLLSGHASVGLLDAVHRGALSHAAERGDTQVIGLLLDRGAEIDPADDQQRTPLHWAIRGGHADAAIALIRAGADVNHPCPKEPAGYTPLHRCASAGASMAQVARALRDAGADPLQRDPRHGRTAGRPKNSPPARRADTTGQC